MNSRLWVKQVLNKSKQTSLSCKFVGDKLKIIAGSEKLFFKSLILLSRLWPPPSCIASQKIPGFDKAVENWKNKKKDDIGPGRDVRRDRIGVGVASWLERGRQAVISY